MEEKFTPIKKIARAGGVLYLIIIITGVFGELLIKNKIVVSGDPAGTAANILHYETLWRIGIAGDLLMHVCDVPLMFIFYLLFKPVNKNLALVAVLFNLVQTAVMVATKVSLVQSLFPLGTGNYLKAFTPDQLHTLSYLSIKSDEYGFGISLMFFGFECLILGYLIIKSGYIPKTIGALMQVAGLCYITNSFALIIAPKIANLLFMLPPFIAETSFCLWLLVKGVDVTKWKEKELAAYQTLVPDKRL
ncbi:MAG: DUF4386 domain-containing protein [Ginsengibacter sp.]